MEALQELCGMVTPEIMQKPEKRRCLLLAAMAAASKARLELELQALEEQRKIKKRVRRNVWVHPFLQRRLEHGHYDNLMQELAKETPELFRNFTRTSENLFNEIVEKVTPHIEREETYFRKPLPAGLRVAITLRFLATGDTYISLQYNFRVSHSAISRLVPETCKAIAKVYSEELMLPQNEDEWYDIADGYYNRWNMPHCIGSIDGKHIRLKNPHKGGSHFFNYKKFYSMVLLAIVDSEYKFMYIDVGAIGSESDAGVFAQTKFRELLEKNLASIPAAMPLPGDEAGTACEFYLVGDDAFPLRDFLMKPYPSRKLTDKERIFNYRLSRARRTVENAFGIMANRFRVFHTAISLHPDNAEAVVIGACVLHNLLRSRNLMANTVGDTENPEIHEIIEGTWRVDRIIGQQLPRPVGRKHTQGAIEQRNYLREYVNGSGAVPWQDKMI